MTNVDATAIRDARRARVRSIRHRVVAGVVALFIATWLLIAVVLVTGHDPALARQTAKSATSATTSSNVSSSAATSSGATSSSTGSSGAGGSSSGSSGSGSSGTSAVTSSQS